MKRLITSTLTSLLLAGMISVPAQAAPQELMVSSIMMENHPVLASYVIPFFREWEKGSNNTIRIVYFNPGTICGANEMLNSAEKGVLAMTMAPLGQNPAMFPGATVNHMPLLFANSRSASLSMLEAAQTLPQLQKEWDHWKIIMASASVPVNLLTVKKPVHVLEDLKGMKIGTTVNDGMDILQSLGATPVLLQLSDMYLALQRGMVDGCILPSPTFRSTKVTEVAKYLTICNFQSSPTPLIMSKEIWNTLPQEARDYIDNIGVEALSAAVSLCPDYFGQVDTDWIVANHKVQMYVLPEEERERWTTAVAPVHQNWVERARRQGVDNPEAILEALAALADKYNDEAYVKNVLTGYEDKLGSLYPTPEMIELLWPEE